MAERELVLVAFLQAQNCSNYPASWRHPDAATDFMSAAYYERIARTLEEGKFQLAFFDDRLAMPSSYNHDFEQSVRYGIRAGPRTFSTPSSPFGVADVEGVALNVMLFTVRPRTMLSEIGAVIDVVVVSPPRPGNTFMFCVSL